MKNTDSILQSAGETVEYARQYVKQQGEWIRLEAAERLAKVFSALATVVVLAFFASWIVVMLSVAFAVWLGDAINSYPGAFLLVGLMYLVASLIIFLFRKQWITSPILTLVLNAFFERGENGRINGTH